MEFFKWLNLFHKNNIFILFIKYIIESKIYNANLSTANNFKKYLKLKLWTPKYLRASITKPVWRYILVQLWKLINFFLCLMPSLLRYYPHINQCHVVSVHAIVEMFAHLKHQEKLLKYWLFHYPVFSALILPIVNDYNCLKLFIKHQIQILEEICLQNPLGTLSFLIS